MTSAEQFLPLLLRHEADVRAFIGSLVLDRHVRDDLFQEVALVLWDRKDDFDPTRSFGAWARGIAAKVILKHRSRDGRFPLLFSPETIQAVIEAYDRTEPIARPAADALRHCLEKVPAKSRELLVLRYEKNLKVAQIAEQTATTLDAVYQALSRLRSRLEDCIRQRLALAEGGR
jgi:RNA polymerase sigma-70 factor (ECF subfamily)